MQSESIEELKKHYRREWLLVLIDEMDWKTTTPLRGTLLAHSANRDEIYELNKKRKEFTLITYTEDALPEGYIAAF